MVGCARALSRMSSRRAGGVFKEAGACALTRAVRDRINRLDYLVLYSTCTTSTVLYKSYAAGAARRPTVD